MVDNIEQQVYELVRPYAGTYLFNIKQVELTPEIDLDTDLSIDELEAEDLMNKFFEELNVERGNFRIETYFPITLFHGIRSRKRNLYPSQISLSAC